LRGHLDLGPALREFRWHSHEEASGQAGVEKLWRQGAGEDARLNAPSDRDGSSLDKESLSLAALAVNDHRAGAVHLQPVRQVSRALLLVPRERGEPAGQLVAGK